MLNAAATGRAWLRVDAADPCFADAVLADLVDIRATPSGLGLLRRIHATGRSVLIEAPGATPLPGAWVRPRDPLAASAGGSDATIAYRPGDWPCPADPGSPPADVMLLALLSEAARQMAGTADPPPWGMADSSLFAAAEVAAYRGERRGP